jgi:hypothetical protein
MYQFLLIILCFKALLLGLPPGSVDDVFRPEETFQNPDINTSGLFSRRLSNIASRIIERNQALGTHAYATTQEIDEMLDSLAKELPQSWWNFESYSGGNRPEATAVFFHRVMIQIWYFQLEAFLHLPFMLRAATERRYDYSKFSCLKASREIIHRYLFLRRREKKSFCCKVLDFGALTATVTLLLNLIEQTQGNENGQNFQNENDRALVEAVLRLMEEISVDGRGVVAAQSVNVIKTLLAVNPTSGQSAGNLRLTIPYFGTINIARTQQTQNQDQPANAIVSQPQESTPTGGPATSQAYQGLSTYSQNHVNPPMVSFTSSQFPPPMPEQSMDNWGLPGTDTFFFDGLFNTDIEGNWVL